MARIIYEAHLLAVAFVHALHQVVDRSFKAGKLGIADAQLCIRRGGVDVIDRILQIPELAFVKLLRGCPLRRLRDIIDWFQIPPDLRRARNAFAQPADQLPGEHDQHQHGERAEKAPCFHGKRRRGYAA